MPPLVPFSYKLVVVESPAKCGKIQSYLGDGYQVMASYGHIRSLDHINDIDLATWKAKYTLQMKPAVREKLQNAIAHAEQVILATDDDREGEAIAWHLCDVFHLPVDRTLRIVFHEITEKAIQDAVRNPRTLDMNRVHSQQARQIIDVLVGFRISPVLFSHVSRAGSKNGGGGSLSAGRCQTPALKMVFERELELVEKRAAVTPPLFRWNVECVWAGSSGTASMWIGLTASHETEGVEPSRAFCELWSARFSLAEKHRVHVKEKPLRHERPPTPFTTSQLLQSASNRLHFPPKKTMACAQRLYEHGYITYMRTDSTALSESFLKHAGEYVTRKYGPAFVAAVATAGEEKKGKKKGSSGVQAQNAHEAIRPVRFDRSVTADATLSSDDKRVYSLIWLRTLQACMSDALYEVLELMLVGDAAWAEDVQWTGEVVHCVFSGWKATVLDETNREHEEDGEAEIAPDGGGKGGANTVSASSAAVFQLFKQHALGAGADAVSGSVSGVLVRVRNMLGHEVGRQGALHHTEAQLVQQLEKRGIGRPSTFAMLVEKIQERQYVARNNVEGQQIEERTFAVSFSGKGCAMEEQVVRKVRGEEKNKLVLRPLGYVVCAFLYQHFDALFRYDFTAQIEHQLDEVAKGERDWKEMCAEYDGTILQLIRALNHVGVSGRLCKNPVLPPFSVPLISNGNGGGGNEDEKEDVKLLMTVTGPVVCRTRTKGGGANEREVQEAQANADVEAEADAEAAPKQKEKVKAAKKPTAKEKKAEEKANTSWYALRNEVTIGQFIEWVHCANETGCVLATATAANKGDVEGWLAKYTTEDENRHQSECVGTFEGEELFIKKGPFGWYAQWGENRQSLKSLIAERTGSRGGRGGGRGGRGRGMGGRGGRGEGVQAENETLELSTEDVVAFLEKVMREKRGESGAPMKCDGDGDCDGDDDREGAAAGEGTVRYPEHMFSEELSARYGPHGPYLFYKTKAMKRPMFVGLKSFQGNWCEKSAEEMKAWMWDAHKKKKRAATWGGRGGGRGKGRSSA